MGSADPSGLTTSTRDRLSARATPEPRKRIVDDDPIGSIIEINVTLRLAVDRTVHVGKDDVDDVGVVARFAEQGTTAAFAERSCAVVGGAESGKLALA
jgi:hypothetical protein